MAEDEERPRTPTEWLSDERLVGYLRAEPSLLGEALLVMGQSIPTDTGDIIDVLAIEATGTVHVIFLPQGPAGEATLESLVPQGAWVFEHELDGLRSIFSSHNGGSTLDAAFEGLFSRKLPSDANTTHVLSVVASSVVEDEFESFETFSDMSDGMVRVVRFQEFTVDDAETALRTERLI